MTNRVWIVTLALVAYGLAALPAFARSVTTIIQPSHGPVQLAACRAAYESEQLAVTVDFKNSGEKAATAVGFSFRAEDSFGQPLQYAQTKRSGSVAAGAEIDNWQGWSVQLTGPVGANLADVTCTVESVHFSDGTDWHAADAQPPPDFPPTPNPEGTP